MQQEMPLEVTTYSSEEVVPVLPLLQEWVEREFLKYPYLWVAPKGVIHPSNVHVVQEARGLVVVVKRLDEVVAVASCVPFDSEPSLQSILPIAREKRFDPSRMLYVSYCLTAEEMRSDESLIELIDQRILEHAKKIGCNQLCVMQDLGRPDHPLKPKLSVPVEPWDFVGGFERMEVELEIAWPTLQVDGSAKEEAHTMIFFYKICDP